MMQNETPQNKKGEGREFWNNSLAPRHGASESKYIPFTSHAPHWPPGSRGALITCRVNATLTHGCLSYSGIFPSFLICLAPIFSYLYSTYIVGSLKSFPGQRRRTIKEWGRHWWSAGHLWDILGNRGPMFLSAPPNASQEVLKPESC